MPQNSVYMEQGGDKLGVDSGGQAETSEQSDASGEIHAPCVFRIAVADGAGDTDVTVDRKIRVLDAWAAKTSTAGGSGDTVTVKNGSSAITDAISLNVSDNVVARAGQLDDSAHEIAAGGTLRATAANATNNECEAYVLAVRVP